MKETLFGKTLDELTGIVNELDLPKYTARQVCDWLYKKNIRTIEEMSNLSKQARSLLSGKYEIGLTAPSNVQLSRDGTKKYMFEEPGGFIESAFISEKTDCISFYLFENQLINVLP